MSHGGIELVQVLLQGCPHQQHLGRRSRGVGPGAQGRQRQAGITRIARLVRLVEVTARDREGQRRIVGPRGEALAQLAILVAAARRGRQHVDRLRRRAPA